MTRAMKSASMFACGVIIAAALASCARTDNTRLDGTRWKLVGWSISSQHAADTGITASFIGASISGHSGVNTYSGPYTATVAGTMSVGPLQITEMAGAEPSMRAERSYMTLLGQAVSYKTRDGKLSLYDQGGNESLIFEPTVQ